MRRVELVAEARVPQLVGLLQDGHGHGREPRVKEIYRGLSQVNDRKGKIEFFFIFISTNTNLITD